MAQHQDTHTKMSEEEGRTYSIFYHQRALPLHVVLRPSEFRAIIGMLRGKNGVFHTAADLVLVLDFVEHISPTF